MFYNILLQIYDFFVCFYMEINLTNRDKYGLGTGLV